LLLGVGVTFLVGDLFEDGYLSEVPPPIPVPVLRCPGYIGKRSTPLVSLPWVLVPAFETVSICLILPKAISQRSSERSNLFKAIYIRGFLFYLYAFAASSANIALFYYPFAPGVHPQFFVSLDRILHSVLAGRLVLSIRGAADSPNSMGTVLSTTGFYVPGSQLDS